MTEYAKCEDCNKSMSEGASCTMPYILIENKRLKRIPYKNPYNIIFCHDCGVELGQIHHYGCDMEICPICKGQLFICDCLVMGVLADKNGLPAKYEDRKKGIKEELGLIKNDNDNNNEKIDLAKNFIELKSCPSCQSKNMEIRDIFDYCVIEYEKSQLDDSWLQKETITGDLKSTELNCLDCGYNDSWRAPKDE